MPALLHLGWLPRGSVLNQRMNEAEEAPGKQARLNICVHLDKQVLSLQRDLTAQRPVIYLFEPFVY